MGNRHLLHVRSNQLVNNEPKLPQPSDLKYGELAINYAKGNETISLKNSEDEIVTFNIGKSIKGINVNSVSATVENNIASVTISGSDENVGTYTQVEYPEEFSSAVNVSGSQTIAEAFNSVETTISALTDSIIKDEKTISEAITQLAEAAGLDDNDEISYVANANANYISGATSLYDADNILDSAIYNISASAQNSISGVNVNGINGTVTDKVASVTISGSDANVGDYTSVEYPQEFTDATNVSGSQTIADAFNAVETTISALTQIVLDDESISGVNVNGISGTVTDKVASVIISGSDANVGDYTSVEYPTEFSAATNVSGSQTIAEAFNAVETTISALTQVICDDELATEHITKAIAEAAGTIDENNEIKYVVNDDAHYISAATSLADADDILDNAIYNIESSSQNSISGVSVNGVSATVTDKVANVVISGSDTNVGTYTSVEYPEELSGAVNVNSGQTVAQAFNAVETTISALTQEIIDDELATEHIAKSLAEAAGTIDSNDEIQYVVNDTAHYISAATSLSNADDLLDAAIYNIESSSQNSISGVSVNGISGTVADKVANVVISGSDTNVGTYNSVEYPTDFSAATNISGSQTVAQAFNAVESTISALTQIVFDDELATEHITKAIAEAAGTIDENNEIKYVVNEDAHYISAATSLSNADDLLDAAIYNISTMSENSIIGVNVNGVSGTVTDKVASVIISGSDANVGTYNSVEYPEEFTDAINVSGSQTVAQAFNAVESTISALTQAMIDDEKTISESIIQLADATGLENNDEISYVADTTANYISGATSLYNADSLLDSAISNIASFSQNSISGVSVNGVSATVTDKVANVVISGSDTNVGSYTQVEYPEELSGAVNVSSGQTVAQAFNAVETTVSALTQEVINNELVGKSGLIAIAEAAGTFDDNDDIVYNVNTDAHYISGATSLADADDLLDAAIYAVASSSSDGISGITVNGVTGTITDKVASTIISGSDTNVGTYTSVEYAQEFSGAVNVSGSQTIAEAFNAVETTISAFTSEILKDEIVTEKAIKKLCVAAGTLDSNENIKYNPITTANYISGATSLAEADELLDSAIAAIASSGTGGGGHIKVVNHGTSDTTYSIPSNEHHIWGEVSSLNITLATPADNTILNEYLFTFTSPLSPTSLSVPSSIQWVFNLEIEGGKTYTVSIVNGLATYLTENMSISGEDEHVLNSKEDISNKVTTIDANSTDVQYPSAKCVYDYIQNQLAAFASLHNLT